MANGIHDTLDRNGGGPVRSPVSASPSLPGASASGAPGVKSTFDDDVAAAGPGRMRVGPAHITNFDGGTRVAAEINSPRSEVEVWYEIPETEVPNPGDVFFAAAMQCAMWGGLELHMEDPVSPSVLEGARTIAEVFHRWWPERQLPTIHAVPADPVVAPDDRGVATFFSGGADSYYTFLKHRDEIDTLIYCHDFDVDLERDELLQRITQTLQRAADRLGKQLVVVRTNVHHGFSSPYCRWIHYHGSALASVALLLSGRLHRIYVPSSYCYASLHPWGTHPLLEPNWSREDLRIDHDGCEASRVGKIRLIASEPIALDSLRVCPRLTGSDYNCGACPKCLRTMASLHAFGALDQTDVFTAPFSRWRVAKCLTSEHERIFMREILEELRATNQDARLQWAIKLALLKKKDGAIADAYRSIRNVKRMLLGQK